MRIESSQLQLNSIYQATTRYSREEQLDIRMPGRNGQMTEMQFRHQHISESNSLVTYESIRKQAGDNQLSNKADNMGKKVETYNNALQNNLNDAQAVKATSSLSTVDAEEDGDFLELSPEDRMRISLIKTLLSSLTGKEIEFSITDLRIPKDSNTSSNIPIEAQAPPTAVSNPQTMPMTPNERASLEYQVNERFYQQETGQFRAQGVIKTSEGQEINIDIDLNMSRELLQERAFSLSLGAALKDPLVISFDGRAAELSQQRFEFDLTIDGQQEWIPTLGQNSAFLALDRNGDGKINDGSELFGAKTGDGFKELTQYDDDGNGWIDENDFIFEHLKLWFKPGTSDSQQLISLKDAGIGAIYLGNADTPFTLNNSLGDERLGVIRSTGIYVSDQGKAGLIQHVDLSI
ncbi:hypothetical protein [Nitrincola schmidtii]|uniref:hypothetical protein n=1 Tax=Nitrincola schmidtii TaxID=1730894 RepID=UPI00124CECE0|nr:hypothetical protein [Nitrincola schmidtii]